MSQQFGPAQNAGRARDDGPSPRLAHRLEIQAASIEEVLLQHLGAGQVLGGELRDEAHTRFEVDAPLPLQREELLELQEDLADNLNVPQVEINHERGRIFVDITQAQAPPVNLLELVEQLPAQNRRANGRGFSLPSPIATLGWAEDERPVQLNLADPDTGHVLIAGGRGAGKTSLLRSCAVSLALHSRQSQVQMLFIDPELPGRGGRGSGLHAMQYLPHVLSALITQPEDAAEVLAFLQEEMVHRRRNGVLLPRIVVFIDRLDALLEEGDGHIRRPLHRLLNDGAAAGIHLLLSTRKPQAQAISQLFSGRMLLRIVGQVDTEAEARAATGVSDSGAHKLLGRGDFLAWDGRSAVRFQAAYIDEYDLHLCLEQLHRDRPPALLARPANIRTHHTPTQNGAPSNNQIFRFDGHSVEWGE